MTKREFFDLSFRLISVFIFLSLLARAPEFLIYYADGYPDHNVLRKTFTIVMFFLVPLAIMWMTRSRSEWFLEQVLGPNNKIMAPEPASQNEKMPAEFNSQKTELASEETELDSDEDEALEENFRDERLTASNIQQIAFVVLGIWILSSSLPTLLQEIVYYGQDEAGGFDLAQVFQSTVQWTRVFGSAIEVAIGVILMTSGDRISSAIDKMRLARTA